MGKWRAFLLVLGLALTVTAHALLPRSYTDVELSRFSVIVVGYWPKAPIINLPSYRSPEGYTVSAATTQLVVQQVIAGDLTPGKYDLHATDFAYDAMSGLRAGPDDWSYCSYPLTVKNPAKPAVWFLTWEESQDPAHPGRALTIINYDGVQGLHLLPLYQALRDSNPAPALSKVLASHDPELVDRALIAAKESKVILKDAVRHVIDGRPDKPRQDALRIYAEWVGQDAVPILRTHLQDRSRLVRATAALELVKLRDVDLIPEVSEIFSHRMDPNFAYEALQDLENASDERFVPVVSAMLQNTRPIQSIQSIQMRDCVALQARDLLSEWTSVAFPLDVKMSQAAWAKFAHSPNRIADLRQAFGDQNDLLTGTVELTRDRAGRPVTTEQTLVARISMTDYHLMVTVTNKSDHQVSIPRLPAAASFTFSEGAFIQSAPVGPADLRPVKLAPGASYRFPVIFEFRRDLANPARISHLSLQYYNYDQDSTPGEWLGELDIDTQLTIDAPTLVHPSK